MLGILNDTEDRNLRSQIDAEVCVIQALSVVSQFIAAQAKCTVRMSKVFFQSCAQPHEEYLYVLPRLILFHRFSLFQSLKTKNLSPKIYKKHPKIKSRGCAPHPLLTLPPTRPR